MVAMTDIAYEDEIHGSSVVAFDGRVLELFTWRTGSAGRLVKGMLFIEVDGPDRRGRRNVSCSCRPGFGGSGFRLTVSEQQWPALEPFFSQVVASLR
jgi:hypothetical protein